MEPMCAGRYGSSQKGIARTNMARVRGCVGVVGPTRATLPSLPMIRFTITMELRWHRNRVFIRRCGLGKMGAVPDPHPLSSPMPDAAGVSAEE
jgi:hypothetical protein